MDKKERQKEKLINVIAYLCVCHKDNYSKYCDGLRNVGALDADELDSDALFGIIKLLQY